MTIDLAIDPLTGDLAMTGSDLALVEGNDAIAQEVQVRLRWWRGEWFLDQRRGVPYLQKLLRKGVDERTVAAVLRPEIMAAPGVTRIESLLVELDRATREASVTIEILGEGGDAFSLTDVPVGG